MAGWTLSELTELELRMRRGGVAELSETPEAPRRILFRAWLERQRGKDPEPGRVVSTILHGERLLAAGIAALAFLSGLGAVKALLWYDGSRLINVSTFLLAMVFGQLGLLLLLFLSKLLFRSSLADLYQRLLRRVPELADSRRLRSIWTLHGFVRLQGFAAAFNFGALIGTAVEGITRDLAFGWGTTLRVSAEDLHRLVSLLARPWGGGFVPSPSEIEASRIVLIQGLGGVDPVSAAAWWPFLLLCLAVYGLLPRLLLCFGAAQLLRHRLRHPDFSDTLSEQLYLRLTRAPLVFTHESPPAAPPDPTPPDARLPAFQPAGPVTLLADAELGEGSDLVPALEKRLGIHIQNRCARPRDLSDPPPGGLLWLLEAWQPPLQEHLEVLRALRDRLGSGVTILLVLTGLPTDAEKLTAPQSRDLILWRNHLATLRDTALGLTPMPAA